MEAASKEQSGLMKVRKTFSPGVVAREMTPAELYACIDYALSSRPDFDLKTIGCTEEGVDRYALFGYNALMDYGVFRLDSDNGYPELTTIEPDIVNFISALDGTPNVVRIRIKVGRNSFPLYFVHTELSWCFFWKKTNPETWFVVAGSCLNSLCLTWLGLTKTACKSQGTQRISFDFQWVDVRGGDLAHTLIVSEANKYSGMFYEQKPVPSDAELINKTDEMDPWPHLYPGDMALGERVEWLLQCEVN